MMDGDDLFGMVAVERERSGRLRCNLEMKSTGLGKKRAVHSRKEMRRWEEQWRADCWVLTEG